ncbi:hypothetical protein PC128_g25450 [Phytophthora cactorum]|nr:hypothetical protein PC128_g25450 [Phytophthora cactorum]KAG4036185.1 hypothetical protein PC123_g28246 [Phytophthora cactorum]
MVHDKQDDTCTVCVVGSGLANTTHEESAYSPPLVQPSDAAASVNEEVSMAGGATTASSSIAERFMASLQDQSSLPVAIVDQVVKE